MLTSALARITLVGFHAWPDAPAIRGYLADRHRHLFHVEAEVSVGHGDREVEIHDLQGMMRAALGRFAVWHERDAVKTYEFGGLSCEHIAAHLATALHGAYGQHRTIWVSVLEDGEAGGRVRSGPTA